jgi:hypothetical protein
MALHCPVKKEPARFSTVKKGIVRARLLQIDFQGKGYLNTSAFAVISPIRIIIFSYLAELFK